MKKKNFFHLLNVLNLRAYVLVQILCVSCSCSKNNSTTGGPAIPKNYDATVTILSSENKQIIRGFGCASAFAPPGTSSISSKEFDRLFGAGDGQVGLTYLRIKIGTDETWRTTELNYSKEVVKRGGKIIACPWTPPARFKTNNSLIGGKLITDSAAAYAKYLDDFANYMASNGAPLYALSVQNEPDFEPTYEGCVFTSTDMRDFLKNQGGKIAATRVMAADLATNNQGYLNTILNDEGALANLDILSVHIYGGGILDYPAIREKGKEFWMTEHLDTNTNHLANLGTAAEIHNCLTKGNFNAYFWWYGKRFYGPIGQDGMVTKRGYFISQFARFIKEGATRLGTSANSRTDVLVSAYRNDTKNVVVVVNTGTAQVNQQLVFKDASVASFIPYVTSETKNAEKASPITITGNSFNYTIPPLSVVTFVDQ